MLTFDGETTALLDSCYVGADATRRRRATFDALRPAPGETILDIGSGGGHLTAELARAVGPEGQVIGVDPSPDMRATATKRCADLPQVTLRDGTATDLGLQPNSIDKAASVQVFEYLDDIPAALTAAHTALRLGGLLAIGDMHFDSFIWTSDDPARMARLRTAWDAHFTNGRVPEQLPELMARAGFLVEDVRTVTLADHQLRPDGLAAMMLVLMERYAVDTRQVPATEARAWAVEQRTRAAEGRFFFSMTHFVVVARKPTQSVSPLT